MARITEDELAEALGAKPLNGLKKLKAADRRHLAQTIVEARERQAVEVEESIEAALHHVPWPLRKALRRIVEGRQ